MRSMKDRHTGDDFGWPVTAPTRNIFAGCCARAPRGQAAKAAIPCINLRRRIACPQGLGHHIVLG